MRRRQLESLSEAEKPIRPNPAEAKKALRVISMQLDVISRNLGLLERDPENAARVDIALSSFEHLINIVGILAKAMDSRRSVAVLGQLFKDLQRGRL